MAKVVWTEEFQKQLDSYIVYASMEFGKSTAQRWADQIAVFEHRLELFPTSYSPERLLQGKGVLYRDCQLMHRRGDENDG